MRRAVQAQAILDAAIRQKHGNPAAWGEFTITLKWKAGMIEHIKVTDEADVK